MRNRRVCQQTLDVLLHQRADIAEVIDSAADTQTIQNHPGAPVAKSTRNSTANAAAFGPVDINATTGAGEPS